MLKKITKKEAQALEKRLAYQRRLVWDELSSEEEEKVWELSEDYKVFLNASKTERETIGEISRRLTQAGFISLDHSNPRGKGVSGPEGQSPGPGHSSEKNPYPPGCRSLPPMSMRPAWT